MYLLRHYLIDCGTQKLAHINSNMGWWIKGDDTNVRKGLWESVSGKWGRDSDLDDGTLECLYKQYENKLNLVNGLGLKDQEP